MGRRRRVFLPALLAVGLALAHPLTAAASTTAGLWHMDETSGTTATDSSSNHNDGTLHDVSFVTPGYNGSGGAYSFNGTSSKVLVANSSSLSPGSKDISISVNVNFTQNPSSTVGDYDVVRKGSSTQFYKIEILGSGKAFCSFHGSSNNGHVTLAPVLNDGKWHKITCKKTSSSISGTIDGKTTTKSVTIGSISNTSSLVFSGKASGSGDLYNGLMDEVSITVG